MFVPSTSAYPYKCLLDVEVYQTPSLKSNTTSSCKSELLESDDTWQSPLTLQILYTMQVRETRHTLKLARVPRSPFIPRYVPNFAFSSIFSSRRKHFTNTLNIQHHIALEENICFATPINIVSERWLATFGRAMRKPRESLGQPGEARLTTMGILRAWMDLEKIQVQARPQDTDRQRKADAERKWWKWLFPRDDFPERSDLLRRIMSKNDVYFNSVAMKQNPHSWIAMKALQENYECLELYESYSTICKKLRAHPDYPTQVEKSDVAHMRCLLWFRNFFPGENFPNQMPKYWSESLELDFLKELQPSRYTNTEQGVPIIANARRAAEYAATRSNSLAVHSGQTPKSHHNISKKPLPIQRRSNLPPVIRQTKPQAETHTPTTTHRSPRLDIPEIQQLKKDLRTQFQAQSTSAESHIAAANQLPNPTPRNTLPWVEEGVSADNWIDSFLDSAVGQRQESAENINTLSATGAIMESRMKRSRDNLEEDTDAKRMRVD
ncbi:hypothetical protein VTL71DRAFT_2114 [Oculimacula yallundae]|uniref:Uncharacterized protein n=1 Tax=Oculimacula yallundae TaxID=86028 RepID=A0ABR4C800_9HELO